MNFDNKKINESHFYIYKRPFSIADIDVDKTLISKKEPYGRKSFFKYFIAYDDHDYIDPLYIKLPQMIGYVTCSDDNKTMSFGFTDNKLLKSTSKYGKE